MKKRRKRVSQRKRKRRKRTRRICEEEEEGDEAEASPRTVWTWPYRPACSAVRSPPPSPHPPQPDSGQPSVIIISNFCCHRDISGFIKKYKQGFGLITGKMFSTKNYRKDVLIIGAHTKRLRTKLLLDKTSPYKTSP
jgi:hypothetical protein